MNPIQIIVIFGAGILCGWVSMYAAIWWAGAIRDEDKGQIIPEVEDAGVRK